jgi:hypothetical protein
MTKQSEGQGAAGVLLLDLNDEHCRWPMNIKSMGPVDPAQRFCGEQKREGSSFCPAHSLRAFEKQGWKI